MTLESPGPFPEIHKLRDSNAELLAAAKEAVESIEALLEDGGNDGIDRCLPPLKAAIAKAEELGG